MSKNCKRAFSVTAALTLLVLTLGPTLTYGVTAKINIDGNLADWVNIKATKAANSFVEGTIKAANDAEYLYLSYEGDWMPSLNFSIDVFVNGMQASDPNSAIVINSTASAESGDFSIFNSWKTEIVGTFGKFVSGKPGEYWGYEDLFFELEVPLGAFNYSGFDVPEISLTWTTLGNAEIVCEKITKEGDGLLAPSDPNAQGESTIGSEIKEEESSVDPTDVVIADGHPPLVSNSLEIDGYYSDWDNILHDALGTGNESTTTANAGALVIQDDNLYVHLLAPNDWEKLPTNNMQLYINGNISYDAQGLPEKGDAMVIALATVGTDMSMGDMLKNTNTLTATEELGAFEYDNWPQRYLGEAAYTIYDSFFERGDECEFFLDLSAIAEHYNINENEINEITMYFPRLGVQKLTIVVVSSGPYLGVAIAIAIVGGYMFINRRKTENVK